MDETTFRRVQESLRTVLERLTVLENATRDLADRQYDAARKETGRARAERLAAAAESAARTVGLVEASMVVLEEVSRVSTEFRGSRVRGGTTPR